MSPFGLFLFYIVENFHTEDLDDRAFQKRFFPVDVGVDAVHVLHTVQHGFIFHRAAILLADRDRDQQRQYQQNQRSRQPLLHAQHLLDGMDLLYKECAAM